MKYKIIIILLEPQPHVWKFLFLPPTYIPIWRDICCAMWTSVTWNDDPCNGEYISRHIVRQKCSKSKFHSTMVKSLCSRNRPDQSNLGPSISHLFQINSLSGSNNQSANCARATTQLNIWWWLQACSESKVSLIPHHQPLSVQQLCIGMVERLKRLAASAKEVGSQVSELDLFHHLFSPLQWPTFSKSEVRYCKLLVFRWQSTSRNRFKVQ